MKKYLLFLYLLLTLCPAFAQNSTFRSKHVDFYFSSNKLKQDDFPSLKSNYGVGFSCGKTFYLHKKELLNCMKFGMDATWIDLNYANYQISYIKHAETTKYSIDQGDVSMHIGASLSIVPVRNLQINMYYHYAPTFASLYANKHFSYGYASTLIGGLSINYKVIGVGIESRTSKCSYDRITFNGEDGNVKIPTSNNGFRTYIRLKF